MPRLFAAVDSALEGVAKVIIISKTAKQFRWKNFNVGVNGRREVIICVCVETPHVASLLSASKKQSKSVKSVPNNSNDRFGLSYYSIPTALVVPKRGSTSFL